MIIIHSNEMKQESRSLVYRDRQYNDDNATTTTTEVQVI